jgi:hypothetical protein
VVRKTAQDFTTETQRTQRPHREELQVTSLHICSYPYEQGRSAVKIV